MAQAVQAARLSLSAADRATLVGWSRRRKTAQALALRARIVLACAEPGSPTDGALAKRLGVCRPTVLKWRRRFAARGVAGLLDEPRVGAPRSITDAAIEQAIATTLESVPEHATHWSTRTLAARVGMSQTAVSRIWRAFALAPHRTESFKLSRDPQFVEKVRDIVGLYLNPPDRALVLCVDEKPSIQATSDTAPAVPMKPGQLERHTHDLRSATARPTCSQRSTSRPAPSSARSTDVTARASFATSWPPSRQPRRPSWRCTWCSITPAPTRRPPSSAGCWRTRACSCTSLRPRGRG